MADYQLFYWPVPFRGQFIRAILAYRGRRWSEVDPGQIEAVKSGPIGRMPVPFVGPPVLVETATGFALAQMPAIAFYLGDTLDLMPATARLRAAAMKVVNDANDLIDELTLDGGKQMWTAEGWTAYRPRLERWMHLWDETGRRHGLTAEAGTLLGTDDPSIADLISAVLWSTMTDRFPVLSNLLEQNAPLTAGHTRRIAAHPALVALAAEARDKYGDSWCGGQIEASLRKVLAASA